MSVHIVTSFDEDLKGLVSSIAALGDQAEQLVDQAVSALMRSDAEAARAAIEADRAINRLHEEIEEQAVLIIARRQPMAQDLRDIISAIRISADLERIGDLGKNIARRTLAIIDTQPISTRLMTGVEHLSGLTLRQLKNVLDSYGSRDLDKARQVWKADDEIDAVYISLFREMLTYMMEDPRTIGMCTHLLFCAKNLERVGDHVTNIAETVEYLVTGKQPETERTETRSAGDKT